MNVCLVSQEYPPQLAGGIGTQTFLKAHGLARLGHVVHVVTRGLDGTLEWSDGDVVVHPVVDPAPEAPFSEPTVHWFSYSQAVAAKVYELHERLTLDLVEFPEYGAEGFVYMLDSKAHRDVPVVVMLHGSLAMFAARSGWPEAGSPFHRFGTFMEETVVCGADLLLAASENIADFWWLHARIPRDGIRVVHTAVDTDAFAPENGRSDGALEVLFVGRIDGEKGVLDVADSVARLSVRHPTLRCRIVGNGEQEDERSLRSRIAAVGAESRFELLGHVPHDRLPAEYARCDVFAAPAPREHGLASVYLEAMASGKPVVASATGGAREAIMDGETGFLVPPDDASALDGALERLLESPDVRTHLGRNGRARVLERFSVDRHVERVLAAYEEVVSANRRP